MNRCIHRNIALILCISFSLDLTQACFFLWFGLGRKNYADADEIRHEMHFSLIREAFVVGSLFLF